MKDKIFVLHKNDLESVEIAKMLKENGWQEGKDLFITAQRKPAWDNLEPEIIDALRLSAQKFKATLYREHGANPAIISMRDIQNGLYPNSVIENAVLMKPDFSHIVGVNIDGKSLCEKIETKKDKSALEFVAELIETELTLEQCFIAAYVSGGRRMMQAFGNSIWMTASEQEHIQDKIITASAIIENKPYKENFLSCLRPEIREKVADQIKDVLFLENGAIFINIETNNPKFLLDPRIFSHPKQHPLTLERMDDFFDIKKRGFIIINNNKDLICGGPDEFVGEIRDIPGTENDTISFYEEILSLDYESFSIGSGFHAGYWFAVDDCSQNALNAMCDYINKQTGISIGINNATKNYTQAQSQYDRER